MAYFFKIILVRWYGIRREVLELMLEKGVILDKRGEELEIKN